MTDTSRERDGLFIDGEWVSPVESSAPFTVIDSTSGSQLGTVPSAGPADVDRAVRAAESAANEWRHTRPEDRAAALEAVREELSARADAIAEIISLEVGTPSNISKKVQVGLPLLTLQGFADAARTFEWDRQVGNSTVTREGVGVVAAITPWNYPLHQLMGKVGGALAAGSTVVAKPASDAPLAAFALADAIAAAGLPAGVFNLVSGSGAAVGEALAGHPGVDLVSFTGSTPVGVRIATAAARNVTRTSLELGGKSASVVLDDAELERAIRSSVSNAFLNSGQTCSAWTRLVVPRVLQEQVLEIAVASVERLRLGHPLDEGTRLGPLVSEKQRESVREHIRRGETLARLVAGGAGSPVGLDEGFYVAPTIFADVDNASALAQEEIFGPVLSVIPYDTEDEAIAIANDSPYGLAGGVWSADVERAERVARRIRTGQVDLNGAAFNPVAPFGGVKASGYGREFGEFGIEEFTVVKAMQR
ncbi:aldehyde dehydrogenase family protein [Microbacterium album]|uniref:aldehyde dehydrogenase (NAD(+)) n=1 Tax=Microbacterium album TaxID=2053191 RepID=A0A917IG79_9MICO|nr:aldehyde dehydrogenase family protein [Microbacterium album]GGH47299.1 aldehyde dehydrogenase [Microbacterium album]